MCYVSEKVPFFYFLFPNRAMRRTILENFSGICYTVIMGTVLKETDIFLPDQNFFTQVLNKHYTEEHAHECYELFYVLSGNATHYVNGVRS